MFFSKVILGALVERGPSLEGFLAGIKLTVHFYSFGIKADISSDPSATARGKVFDAMNTGKELPWGLRP